MTKKNKEDILPKKEIKTVDDLLAYDRVAKYLRKQKLLVKFISTKIGNLLLGKKLYLHKDIVNKQNELLNNLFGDKLEKVDSKYIDNIFLLYSKRKNRHERSRR
jgi:hypothetical protein